MLANGGSTWLCARSEPRQWRRDCGPEGVFVGNVPLLKHAGMPGAWSIRPLAELNDELSAHYRLQSILRPKQTRWR